MLRTIVACTAEIDDPQAAVEEILGQLNISKNLCASSIGIIACHYEFVFSGVYRAVCESLPFEVTGTITSAAAVNGQSGTLLLTLMLITGDDVRFDIALTDTLEAQPAAKIEAAYRRAVAPDGPKPALALMFAPFMIQNSGDEYVETFSKTSGGVPCFGTLSVDDSADFSNCFMLHNGDHYNNRMSLVFMYGRIEPKFAIATISEKKILDKTALITASQGHILKEVNGQPVIDFFRSLGLAHASETQYAMTSLPFLLDFGDGSPKVSRVFVSLNEQGQAMCAGAMPEGATLYIGVFDKDDVLLTTRNAVQSVGKGCGMLMYSCISRNMSLLNDVLAELTLVQQEAGQTPFLMGYSGGEVCPTEMKDTMPTNRFHNNTFILCAFTEPAQ